MLGTALQNKGSCAEESDISQHSHFSSPADANYSLLNVNWGNISPTQRSFRDGPAVYWEQKSLPPKPCSFLPPTTTQTGKHREVTKWVWTCESSQPQGLSLGPGCDVKLEYEVEARGRQYLTGRGATRVLHYWAVWQHSYTINYTETTNLSFLEGRLPMGPPYCHFATLSFLFSALASLVEFSTSIKILLLLSGNYQGLPPQGSPPWLYTSHSHVNTLTFPQCYHNTLFGPLLNYFWGLCISCQIWKTSLMGL